MNGANAIKGEFKYQPTVTSYGKSSNNSAHYLVIKYIINFVTRSAAQWESVLKKSLAMFLVSQLSLPPPPPPPSSPKVAWDQAS